MKTPEIEEILEKNYKEETKGFEGIRTTNFPEFFKSSALKAMQEYGDLRHNAAVEMCAESARTTDPRNFIKVKTDSILKNKV